MLDKTLLEALVCPVSRKPLRYDIENNELISDDAGLAYPVENDIPILLVEEARKIESSTTVDGK